MKPSFVKGLVLPSNNETPVTTYSESLLNRFEVEFEVLRLFLLVAHL